jgi:hypothetical protein
MATVAVFSLSHMTTEEIRKEVLKWIGVAVAAIVPLGAIYGIATYIVRSEVSDVRSDLASIKSDVSDLRVDNKKTNDRIDTLLKDALERAFPKPTASPVELRKSLEQVPALLNLAQNQNIKLNTDLIRNYGKQVDSLSRDPSISAAVWKTTKTLIDYRTFLNESLAPTVPTSKGAKGDRFGFVINVRGLPGFPFSSYSFGLTKNDSVPVDEGAMMQPMKPNSAEMNLLHPEAKFVPRYIAMSSPNQSIEVSLDGMLLRNVIFQNLRIVYQGGPLFMKNVYFVNCTFEMQPSVNTHGLAVAMLAPSPATTFSGE